MSEVATEEYATKDIWLATYFQLNNLNFIRVDVNQNGGNGRKPVSMFVFQETERRKELESKYRNRNAMADVGMVSHALKDMKALSRDAIDKAMKRFSSGS